MSNKMKVYVGTYGKYNNGDISGAWLDIEDYSSKDDFYDACRELHSSEPDAEFMFQDYEGIPSGLIGESWIDEFVFELANEEDETIENFSAFIDAFNSESFSDFENAFQGRHDSEVAFAEYIVESYGTLGGIPEHLQYYFDYEKYANELFISDYYFDDETGAVFLRNW